MIWIPQRLCLGCPYLKFVHYHRQKKIIHYAFCQRLKEMGKPSSLNGFDLFKDIPPVCPFDKIKEMDEVEWELSNLRDGLKVLRSEIQRIRNLKEDDEDGPLWVQMEYAVNSFFKTYWIEKSVIDKRGEENGLSAPKQ